MVVTVRRRLGGDMMLATATGSVFSRRFVVDNVSFVVVTMLTTMFSVMFPVFIVLTVFTMML